MFKLRANIKTTEVALPMGIYLKKHDAYFNTCVVKTMDGDAEESITEKRLRNNGAKMVTRLLATRIIKVGEYDYPDGVGEDTARNMFTEDRDTCIVAIRGLMDDEMAVDATCPKCGEKYPGVIFMSELLAQVKQWGCKDLHDESLPLGVINFELKDGLWVSSEETDNQEVLCKKGTLRMPTGVLEEKIASMNLNSVGKINSVLLASSVTEIEHIRKVDEHVVRAMTRVDREYLTDIVNEAKTGPNMLVDLTCDVCDNDFKFMLNLPYFFTVGKNQM